MQANRAMHVTGIVVVGEQLKRAAGRELHGGAEAFRDVSEDGAAPKRWNMHENA